MASLAREARRWTLPLPESVLSLLLGRAGLPRLSRGALAHIKYPIVVDAGLFRRETGVEHHFDELTTVHAFAEAVPPRGPAGADSSSPLRRHPCRSRRSA